MMHFRTLAGAIATAGLMTAMPAAAVIKIATYSGVVASGYDQTGVFGAAKTDLAGASYVAIFVYDKTLGAYRASDGVRYDYSYGGPGYGNSPIIRSSIAINGVTHTVAGTYAGSAFTANFTGNDPGVEHVSSERFDNGITHKFNELGFNLGFNNSVGLPTSLDQNFGPVAATRGFGSFAFYTFRYSRAGFVQYVYADLSGPAVYSVSDPVRNAVPEPASWALMIVGFGMVGVVARRRKASVAA
jgi:hypothetical protein